MLQMRPNAPSAVAPLAASSSPVQMHRAKGATSAEALRGQSFAEGEAALRPRAEAAPVRSGSGSGGTPVVQRKVVLDDDNGRWKDDQAVTVPANFYAKTQSQGVETLTAKTSFAGLKQDEELYIFGHGSEGANAAPALLKHLNHSKLGVPDTWAGTLYLGYCSAGVGGKGEKREEGEEGEEGKEKKEKETPSLVSAIAGGIKNKGVTVKGVRGKALSQYSEDENGDIVAERTVKQEMSMLFSPNGNNDKEKAEFVAEKCREYFKDREKEGEEFAKGFIDLLYSGKQYETKEFKSLCNKVIALCDKFGVLFDKKDEAQVQKEVSQGFGDWGKRSVEDKLTLLGSLDGPDIGDFLSGIDDGLAKLYANSKLELSKRIEQSLDSLTNDVASVTELPAEVRDEERREYILGLLKDGQFAIERATKAHGNGKGDLSSACGEVQSAAHICADLFASLKSGLNANEGYDDANEPTTPSSDEQSNIDAQSHWQAPEIKDRWRRAKALDAFGAEYDAVAMKLATFEPKNGEKKE